METFLSILIPLLLAVFFLRLCLIPMGWLLKIGINSLAGCLCLWFLNLISGFTGVFFPINLITAAIAGFLGIPGIVLLYLLQLL